MQWSVTNGIGRIENGTFTAAELNEDTVGQVTAEFNGMSASAEITVTRTVKPVPDTTAPAVPKNLKAIPGYRSVTLFWDANTEPDLAGYMIYDGSDTPISVEAGVHSKTITGLEDAKEYRYRIAAVDKSGNISDQSRPVKVTTLSGPAGEDVTAPEWMNGKLKAKHITSTGLELRWTEAVDDTAVASYRIYKDGVLLATVPGDALNYKVSGLEPGRKYTFRVEAGDRANNWSTEQLSLTVKTLPDRGHGHGQGNGNGHGPGQGQDHGKGNGNGAGHGQDQGKGNGQDSGKGKGDGDNQDSGKGNGNSQDPGNGKGSKREKGLSMAKAANAEEENRRELSGNFPCSASFQ
ncbi:fibronectin type III domain-containing protein [Paenibacillus sp. P25]|nr:fibronectin type III domain-containing protein [Paenibacillus sp. P25]